MECKRLKKFVLLAALFLLNGCALNQLFLSDEIDRVNIVKYTPYVKEHKAYFTRTQLKPVWGGKKYLFVYSPKKEDLSILLRKGNTYLLYSFTRPNTKVRKFTASSGKSLRYALRKAGYSPVKDLTKLGFVIHTGLRRYKNVKTLMVDVKDYRPLKKRYEEAIRTYDAGKVSGIDTYLPKKMISNYFTKYLNRAQTPEQKEALHKIASKLKLGIRKEVDETTQIEPLFPYYLHHASIEEIDKYLKDPKTKETLSDGEYKLLEHRLNTLQKKRLLEEGSLETLIAEYKKNQDPEFKKHILTRIKQLQEN
jgi:hypothetical protein